MSVNGSDWVLIVENETDDDIERHVFGPFPTEDDARAAAHHPAARAVVSRGLGVGTGWVVEEMRSIG